MPKNVLTNLSQDGHSSNRPICVSTNTLTTALLCMETRSFQPGYRFNAADLVSKISVCIPSILPNKQNFAEDLQGKSQGGLNGNSNLAHSTLVPSTSTKVNKQTSIAYQAKKTPLGKVHL